MAKLAESRDPETGNHLERIRHYSYALAKTLREEGKRPDEIDHQFLDNLFLTSPLHDIGKIGIPDFILLKPGRLDDEEFDVMKSHSRIGYKTLNDALERYPNAEYLQMSSEIALCHHEKFDGSGYPDGLLGEAIPLPARIVAVADVYDALINKRVYKAAYDHPMARSIILQGIGSHFDPMVVEAFLHCEQEFKQIFEKFRDSVDGQ